jgi:hypothetical protein
MTLKGLKRMSIMIPPYVDESVTSNGERKFFDTLKGLSDDFVVLHSLGLAYHREKVFGEIDFVIVCQEGVLSLEVKGGEVHRKDGIWSFTDRYGRERKKTEDPFQQVISAMHSLRDHLLGRFGFDDPVSRCQYACGVVFPDIPFTARGPDIISEVVFDSRSFYEDTENYIRRVFDYWRNQLQEKHGFSGGRLTKTHIERLTSYLRGDFGFVPSLVDIIEETDNRLLALTNQQAQRLAMASQNPRILLKGAAGTGKTLLSLEHARRCVLTGKKVLYICFNRKLNSHLKMQVGDMLSLEPDQLKIDTFHNYLTSCLEENSCMPSTDGKLDNEYFQWELPEAFIEMVESGIYEPQYDVLIVDEGQDLLRDIYLICMDAMVKGGLKEGNWHVCYDPNQNIYNEELNNGLEALKLYNPVVLQLDTNCRNTREIGHFNVQTTGFPAAKYFRLTGEQVVMEAYDDWENERRCVIKAVKKLLAQGVPPGKICLLSKYRYENSCLEGENIFQSICRFQDITNLEPELVVEDSLRFCTIHSFKGLEAPVIFLLDVENFSKESSKKLNYTAISRATSLLYIFYNKAAHDERKALVKESQGLLEV